MSWTKRTFEQEINNMVDNYTDADYQYEMWKEKQLINYTELTLDRDEDYWREYEDEKFQRDFNDYWENRHEYYYE